MAAEIDSPTVPQPLVGSLQGVFVRHPEVRLALLFGSQASGTATAESDVDLAVLGSTIDKLHLAADLSQACQREVDLVSLDDPSIALLEEVIRDGILLWESEANANSAWRSHALSSLEFDRPWYNRMRDAWL
jgi:predicted nucleotidyltransferase